MKPAQWTAVLVLALMVGGISFVSVYLGGSNRDDSETPPSDTLPSLTFAVKVFPQKGERVPTTEVHKTGYQDFWFTNDSGQDVPVGLIKKGCTCSEVEIAVVPPSGYPGLMREVAGWTLLPLPLREAEGLALASGLLARQQWIAQWLDAETKPVTLMKENSFTVPAGAVGRVRLSWQRKEAQPLTAYANLWTGKPSDRVDAHLEAGVLIARPLKVDRRITLPAITERDLVQKSEGLRGWIQCVSMTRPSFRLQAKLLHERGVKPESDPVEVGTPVPLIMKGVPIQENEDAPLLTALSGYRVPVTIRARAKDGTPMEWGSFRRIVELSSPDEGIDPVQVELTGEVSGDIHIGQGQSRGTIHLGPFSRKRGTRGSITLQTDEPGIELELDTSHKVDYLVAELSKPEETGTGHRSWLLHVEVPPDAAWGEFPNPDNPDYRDSAIYVKTRVGKTEKSPRSIRIPVRGVAN